MIVGKTFRFERRSAGEVDVWAIETDDPALRPLARLLPELWLVARAQLFKAIARREGYEVPGAGFQYDGHGGVEINIDGDEVTVSEQLFEELVEAYSREATASSL